MARMNKDFDEFCDPLNPRTITYEDVLSATQRIRKHIEPTPCIASHFQNLFGMKLFYKLETFQPTGSFKGRGALNALEMMPRDEQRKGVVLASAGNQALGVCYYAQKMKIPVTVVMSNIVPITKLQKCQNYGAKVIVHGDNYHDAQKHAKYMAREMGLTFINARDHPDIIAGYGSIALEILDQVPDIDAVLVPVGSGGLAAAITAVIKKLKPHCLVYSLEAGKPMTLPWTNSVADSIAMSNIGVNAFHTAKALLDKMILVNEDWIARAVLHFVEKERFVVEGAGASPLAAIMAKQVPELKQKTVVCITSGGNIDAVLLGRCLDRGRAAEGRLVKFKVGIPDSSVGYEGLLRLLADNNFNMYRLFPDRAWVEDEMYSVEVKVVCETTGLDHAIELKRTIEKAYPNTALFEAEPYDVNKTCPCYYNKPSKSKSGVISI
ncbi:L-threonine ammonia-lyase-like isoform X2 [Aricia agestis]|uniref:L-threonine ammonia-lyase-like isoform X2 n=1 Tax=Aricia agestis TaxID=91739 RepID=UPI001C202DB1|nr:L-threonine ammonia-lyase-like isoform X2 [Aricia agestis]